MLKKSQELFDSFDVDAKYHGWQEDQGSPTSAGHAEDDYLASKAALVKRIEYLERTIYKYKHGHSPKK